VSWLENEARYAEQEFKKTASRFVEPGNDFLHRLADSGVPELDELPEELVSGRELLGQSHFYFHEIERVAAPASPLLLLADLVRGLLGSRQRMLRDAQDSLDQLLEVNSSKAQSDIDERIRESRKKLESEIKRSLAEASLVADRALAHAKPAQAAGVPAVEAALARLDNFERKIVTLLVPKQEHDSSQ